jgi:hypothetical protein
MTEKPIRRTQVRVAERERARNRQMRGTAMEKAIPLILGAIAILFIALVAYATANQASVSGSIGPRLQVDRDQIDLGRRIFNQPVRAAFNLKNIGDSALKLEVPRLANVLEGC